MSRERPSSGWSPLRWQPLGRLPRMTLSALLLPLVVVAGNALILRVEIGFVDRARATEALALMGHVRKEIVLERAQRPAARLADKGDPAALSTLGSPATKGGLVIRYAREGDRVVARFGKADKPDEQGVWVLSPMDLPGSSDWVSNWRCTSRSSGKWQHIAQSTCPDDGSSR